MALVRLLAADPDWDATVLLPDGAVDGAFDALPASVPRRARGVAQQAGGSSASALGALGIGTRLLVQAAATRTDPAVRSGDLIVANTTRSAGYAALALTGSRRPLVVHLRDRIDVESLGGFGHRLMTRIVLPRADGVIANSQATLATAAPYLRPDAVGAAIPSPSGLRPRMRGIRRPGPLRIGMLARIDPWKGQELLLDAFALAFGKGDEQLILAGGAPFGHEAFAESLRARAEELGLGDRVLMPGHVSDVDGALDDWDIAVQYSLRPEPLGQNVLQALAAGTTVVAADEGGPVEWVQHERNGLLVPARDERALAATLRRLADDPALRARLSDAAPRTPGLADDHEIARLHGEVFREVLRRRGR
ncbi:MULTISPECIES: glycosyltransferase family 4 protein [unclassified Microbacterium]|uniref:glycosyltransferase family 4 protein n=1 Tax=unclassified Microbacterium TaxID=2609290 RepID=UPI0012FB4368|nr:glycosyltransferase family 4 protein [Microbacterium sp. MAH-37]MVQ42624.1 glycosyltransferase [Microbacterium sp. MAH-37]